MDDDDNMPVLPRTTGLVATVVEGSLILHVGGKEYRLEAGDSIYFNSNTPHRWRNPGDVTMRAIWVITPPSF